MLSEDLFFLRAEGPFRQSEECLANGDGSKFQITLGFFTSQRHVDPCLEV